MFILLILDLVTMIILCKYHDPRVKFSFRSKYSFGTFFLHTLNLCFSLWVTYTHTHMRAIDSPYYSKSELCGGVVTVCSLKYFPWQVMHFLQRSTHFSKMCCRLLITLKFLAMELPFHGWKSPEIVWGEIWTVWWMF
jgi:hypothetical protein